MITKIEKPKNSNTKSNSSAGEKPQKIIKKVDSETTKLKKIQNAVKAAVVEAPVSELTKVIELPTKKKAVVTESSKAAVEDHEIEDAEASAQMEEDATASGSNVEDAEALGSDAEEANNEDDVEEDQSDNDEDNEIEDSKEETSITEEECDVGLRQTVFVNYLPPNISRAELAKLFAPYGNIMSILFVTRQKKFVFKICSRLEGFQSTSAYVVFDTIEAATKAQELNGTLLNKRKLFVVNPELHERLNSQKSIVVTTSKPAPPESLRKIFSSCGEIVIISMPKPEGDKYTSYVCFGSSDAVSSALELNNTLLDEQPITIEKYVNKKKTTSSEVGQTRSAAPNPNPEKAIFVKNLKNTTTDNLHRIFSTCGEIDHIKILPRIESASIVCFKNPDTVSLALKLDGSMHDEQAISVSKYVAKTHRSRHFPQSRHRGGPSKNKNSNNYNTQKPTTTFKHLGKDDFKQKMQEIGLKYLNKLKSSDNRNAAQDGTKKKSDFRGVRSEGIKKTPKKAASKM